MDNKLRRVLNKSYELDRTFKKKADPEDSLKKSLVEKVNTRKSNLTLCTKNWSKFGRNGSKLDTVASREAMQLNTMINRQSNLSN